MPLHRIARALGVRYQQAELLLQAAPTVEALLHLHQLAQYLHLALANRVWPHCTWLDWENRQRRLTVDLIRGVFGRELLEYVQKNFDNETVLQDWADLEVPSQYRYLHRSAETEILALVPHLPLILVCLLA